MSINQVKPFFWLIAIWLMSLMGFSLIASFFKWLMRMAGLLPS